MQEGAEAKTLGVERFGEQLRRRRVAAGLTQEGLAHQAGLSPKAVSDLERDSARTPRLRTVTLLADALGLEAEERAQILAAARPDAALATDLGPTLSRTRSMRQPSSLPLPTAGHALVGRSDDVDALVGLLRTPDLRLITVTGTGGVGKTRVAIEAAGAASADFADGMFMVDLTAVDEPELVASALLQAVDLPASGEHGLEGLARWLNARRVLLVLDNFEHVVDAAPLLGDLLAQAPGLTLLVTSRIRLHLSFEWEQPLAPLPCPSAGRTTDPGEAASSPAVRLLIDRAMSAGAQSSTVRDHTVITEICRRLDGLPLAIELAAARLKSMPPKVLLERLTEPLVVLTGGYRDLPDRQRTLRDTVEWSYRLLTPEERRVFADGSVFAGDFSVEAAEAICGRDLKVAVVDVLAALADHSLLTPSNDTDEARFRMLHVLREYARERLESDGRAELVRQRHAEFYLDRVVALEPVLYGPDKDSHLSRFDRDFPNVRAALRWALAHPDVVDLTVLARSLFPYWGAKLRLAYEGLQWIEAAVGCVDSDWAKAELLVLLSRLAWMANHPSGGRWADEALQLCQHLGHIEGECQLMSLRAGDAWIEGNHVAAWQRIEDAVALSRRSSNRRVRCYVLAHGIQLADDLGHYATASSLVDEYIALASEPSSTAYLRRMGDLHQARAALFADDPEQCLALLPEPHALEWDETLNIEVLTLRGAAHVQRGEADEARVYLLRAFNLSWANRVVLDRINYLLDIPITLHGLGAVAALQSNVSIAATMSALATIFVRDAGSKVTTRIERHIFIPVITDATSDVSVTDWTCYTQSAQQLLKEGIVEGVKALMHA